MRQCNRRIYNPRLSPQIFQWCTLEHSIPLWNDSWPTKISIHIFTYETDAAAQAESSGITEKIFLAKSDGKNSDYFGSQRVQNRISTHSNPPHITWDDKQCPEQTKQTIQLKNSEKTKQRDNRKHTKFWKKNLPIKRLFTDYLDKDDIDRQAKSNINVVAYFAQYA